MCVSTDVGGNFLSGAIHVRLSLSVMSTTPGYRLTSPSTSPLYGPFSVFTHRMVKRHNGPTLFEVETILPATSHYKLDELISGTDGIDGDGEEKASNWISKLLTDAQKKRLHAEPKLALLKLENYQGFTSGTHIRPDVVLLTKMTMFSHYDGGGRFTNIQANTKKSSDKWHRTVKNFALI